MAMHQQTSIHDLEKSSTAIRLSPMDRMPTFVRNHLVAMTGEFIGTFMFLFFAFAGTQTANTPRSTTGDTSTDLPTGPQPLVILYISLSFSVSLAATAWTFYRISGSHFNPAVTLSLCLIRAITPLHALLLVPTQLLASIASAAVVRFIFPGPLAFTTGLNGGTTTVQGVFIEMFLTAQLIMTIFMLAVEKSRASFLAPLGIAMSLFIAELAGVFYTGGSLNPARSFGPCVANQIFPSERWIYWVGPLAGGVLASGVYGLVKVLRYESAGSAGDWDEGRERLLGEAEGEGGRGSPVLPRLNKNGSFGRPLSIPGGMFEGDAREG